MKHYTTKSGSLTLREIIMNKQKEKDINVMLDRGGEIYHRKPMLAHLGDLWGEITSWSRHGQIEYILNKYQRGEINLLEAEVLLSQIFGL